MSDFSKVIIGSVGDTLITMDDLIFELKLDFRQKTVDNMVDRLLLKVCAKDMNIAISDSELQAAADKFRIETGLLSANETNEWLEENGLSIDEFERKLENDLLKSKIENDIATEEKINKLFAEGIIYFEKAKIAEIVVADKGLAEEIKAQLDEKEAEFSELAIKYSIDKESADRGGVVGPVNRNDLPDEVAVEVFADDAKKLIGPIEANGDYYVIKLIAPKKADPEDEHTRDFIKNQLFEDFVNEKTDSIGIKMNLF
jgi:parvulin-like peptidyl-prolyl isomerase